MFPAAQYEISEFNVVMMIVTIIGTLSSVEDCILHIDTR